MGNEMAVRNSVKLILVNEKKELLLMSTDDKGIKGKDGNYNGRFWQMIGGKIEEGELPEQTAIREMKEETGLDVKKLKCKVGFF